MNPHPAASTHRQPPLPPHPRPQSTSTILTTTDTYSPSPTSHQSPSTGLTNAHAQLQSGLQVRSCTTCRKRKVKCDKALTTCSNCARAGIRCEYPAPGRKPRRPKEGVSARETELLKRLRKLEGVVDELSGQIDVESGRQGRKGSTGISTPTEVFDTLNRSASRSGKNFSSTEQPAYVTALKSPIMSPGGTETGVEREIGRLVVDEGKSRYVSNTFWASMAEEVEDIREMLYDDSGSEEEADSASPESSHAAHADKDHHSFLLGYSSSNVDLRPLHPLPSQILFYWQTFKENIHPLTGLLHVPTMDKAILEIKDNLDGLARSTEALAFAIYYAVLTSLSEEQVMVNLGVEKKHLLSKYRFAIEQALAKANFLNTSELVTLQAFVLFLVCVRRHDDTRFVWTLTGLAIRMGESLGLHRDGATFGLSPFDVEIRRRLFWQMMILDVRASEDHGSSPTIINYDTKLPLNIFDIDISPEMTEPPAERVGVSDLTFCLIRYEIIKATRSVLFAPANLNLSMGELQGQTVEEKEEKIRYCHELLETKYLRFCEGAGPLYETAATIARLIISKMGLVIYHPFHNAGGISGLSYEKRTQLFIASTNIIEYSQTLQNSKETQMWGWLFVTYVQWHAIAFCLGELCVRPRNDMVERAWNAVNSVFADWQTQVSHSKNGMLWLPMRKLMAKAQKKWDADDEARSRLQEQDTPQSDDLGIFSSGSVTNVSPPQQFVETPQEEITSAFTAQTTSIGATPPYTGEYAFVPSIEIGGAISQRQYHQAGQFQFTGMGDGLGDANEAANANINVDLSDVDVNGILQPTADVDMNALSSDVNWQDWDAMIKEYQMEVDSGNPDISVVMGGNLSWW